MRAIASFVLLASLGCGRANPRLTDIIRSEGDLTSSTALQYDAAGHVLNVERSVGDEPPADATEYTWVGDQLVEITRTLTLEDALAVTTSVLTFQQDRILSVTATQQLLRPEQEAVEVSEEIFTVEYQVARIDALSRTFEDQDGNSASTLTAFSYDADGLIEVRADSIFKNNGARDEEISTVTTVAYEAGRPAIVSIAQDGGRATTQTVAYKNRVLEQAVLAIPDNDEFGNEVTRAGEIDYRYDNEERLSKVTISADGQTDIVFDLEYVDADDASAVDLMPAGLVALPLWDLRGASYDVIDARTQVARMVGAAW